MKAAALTTIAAAMPRIRFILISLRVCVLPTIQTCIKKTISEASAYKLSREKNKSPRVDDWRAKSIS
jgi:hypothetical protein